MHRPTALALLLCALPAFAAGLPPDLHASLGAAAVAVQADQLIVSTGAVRRTWAWTGHGLVTNSLRDAVTGREWAKPATVACDWSLPGALDDRTPAELVSVTVREDDDAGFSSKHLEVVSTMRYETAHLELQHVIWVFPSAPGLRTQLRAKALPGWQPAGKPEAEGRRTDCGGVFAVPSARADQLPLDFAARNERLYWGYYKNPGQRHDQSLDMLREQTVKGFPIFRPEDIDWASAIAVKYGDAGVIAVKESPKCANDQSHYTGSFYAGPTGLAITGWGLKPTELVPDRFRDCWATWSLVYRDGDDGLQRAVKQFDAARYPVIPQRDLFILANTWGPANPGGAQFTSEEFILKELPALADLGVDVLQIDDGWQRSGGGPGARSFLPKYKHGWKDIKAAADKVGLRLGLWVAIRNAKLEDLRQNLDELGFVTWKADYDHLGNRADFEARVAAIRAVMQHAPRRTQFTLCPEYDDPRYGWYFAKEYGSIYFQNIQEGQPAHLTMVPYQVLRQHWLMCKYFPANKLQVMLQNPQRTRADLSDARQHGHGYCFAMGLPFVPCFFQSAQFLDPAGRDELRKLIAVYKGAREDLFTSTTYPLGDLPDNASWSGFQLVSTQRDGGHVLLFRELHNAEPARRLVLKFLAGRTIELTDLERGGRRTVKVGDDGGVEFSLAQPASYLLARYTVK